MYQLLKFRYNYRCVVFSLSPEFLCFSWLLYCGFQAFLSSLYFLLLHIDPSLPLNNLSLGNTFHISIV